MLASINPLGERGRNSRFGITLATYTVASVAGGAALGALLGLAGGALRASVSLSPEATATFVVVLCAAAVLFDAGVFGLRVPTIHRQVNEDLLDGYREWVYGSSFGFQLGLGVVTIVTSATVYLAFALTVLTGSALAGLLVGAVFGASRASPMVLVSRVHDPYQLRQLLERLERRAPLARRGTLVLLSLVVAVCIVGLWRSWNG
jgi:Cytochrome C biogenesis protein transmembrane region